MEPAIIETQAADIFMVVGTSLLVYPAAGLLNMAPAHIPKYIIDPKLPDVFHSPNLFLYEEMASTGLAKVANALIREYATD